MARLSFPSWRLRHPRTSLRKCKERCFELSHQLQQPSHASLRLSCTGFVVVGLGRGWYCILFNHGAPVRLAVAEQGVSMSLVAHASNTQRGFLQAVMKTDVRFGDFYGVDLLLNQWERYSLYHATIHWAMKSLKVIELTGSRELTLNNHYSPLMVSITADLRVRFSRRTIEEVFPHLVGDEALTQLLIGLEVTYPCINHFHFNGNGKIERYTPEVDFIGALTGTLKRPELVARVMGNALIEKDHMIGDECDGRQPAAMEMEGENA